jgi:hypothetical protein
MVYGGKLWYMFAPYTPSRTGATCQFDALQKKREVEHMDDTQLQTLQILV